MGGYDAERDEWRPFDPDKNTWGEARPLFPRRTHSTGVTLIGDADTTGAIPNFGIMQERLNGSGSRHSINGHNVSETDAMAALKGELADDSQKLHLTVIGKESDRRNVLSDLDVHPALAAVRDKVLVQGYDPNHWAVADAGFRVTGQPTIYLQAPGGKVLHRQDDYRGPDQLAAAIRRADPSYQPDQDPDLNKTNPPPAPTSFDLSRIPGWGCGAFGAGLAFLILRRRTSQ